MVSNDRYRGFLQNGIAVSYGRSGGVISAGILIWNIKDKGEKYLKNKDTSFTDKVQEKMKLLNEKGGEEIG